MFVKVISNHNEDPSIVTAILVAADQFRYDQLVFSDIKEYRKFRGALGAFYSPFSLMEDKDWNPESNKTFSVVYGSVSHNNKTYKILVDRAQIYIMNNEGKSVDSINVW